MQSIINGVGMTSTMCSGPLDNAMTRAVKPAVVNQEPATPIPLSPYHHQGGAFNATTPDCHYTQSPKPVCHMEDVMKIGPMEETAPSASLTSELAIISHHSLPTMLKRPPIHYPRDGTFPMNFGQSCLSFACFSPPMEVTTTGHDDCELLLHLTIVPEEETMRGNMDSEMAF